MGAGGEGVLPAGKGAQAIDKLGPQRIGIAINGADVQTIEAPEAREYDVRFRSIQRYSSPG